MKINSSQVNIGSERLYESNTQVTQATMMRQAGTGNVRYSSSSFFSSYAQYSRYTSTNRNQYDSFNKSMQDKDAALPSDLYNRWSNNAIASDNIMTSWAKFQAQLIARLEEFMEQVRNQLLGIGTNESQSIIDLTTGSQPGTFWTRQTYQSVTVSETESTTFNGNGTVVTADGRTIDFNISMEMSRSFTETVESLTAETQYMLTDPLVIKLDDAPDTISDQTWFFDIDGDGIKEEISELAKGNGFLALDLNDNGIIDDGSELFGTKSGNGFRDLAAYDEDGNGWIDENDAIYSKLKIWVKDASGNDKLIDLGEADIGAIYLGSASTAFSHKSSDNDTQAVVRETGFYLHESTGAAGIVQQIDFATKEASGAA